MIFFEFGNFVRQNLRIELSLEDALRGNTPQTNPREILYRVLDRAETLDREQAGSTMTKVKRAIRYLNSTSNEYGSGTAAKRVTILESEIHDQPGADRLVDRWQAYYEGDIGEVFPIYSELGGYKRNYADFMILFRNILIAKGLIMDLPKRLQNALTKSAEELEPIYEWDAQFQDAILETSLSNSERVIKMVGSVFGSKYPNKIVDELGAAMQHAQLAKTHGLRRFLNEKAKILPVYRHKRRSCTRVLTTPEQMENRARVNRGEY